MGRTEGASQNPRILTGSPTISAREPKPILRIIGGPLLLYHALILGGAFLLVFGYARGVGSFEILGIVLAAAGVLTEGLIVAWAARLTRKAAGRGSVSESAGAPGTEPPLPGPRRVCVRCGRAGKLGAYTCARCGAPCVGVPD